MPAQTVDGAAGSIVGRSTDGERRSWKVSSAVVLSSNRTVYTDDSPGSIEPSGLTIAESSRTGDGGSGGNGSGAGSVLLERRPQTRPPSKVIRSGKWLAGRRPSSSLNTGGL
eukprot:scaffold9864_cov71-Cyclotella_meneghiniana.AAC.1